MILIYIFAFPDPLRSIASQTPIENYATRNSTSEEDGKSTP
jgi:hypothetical protein